MNKIKKYDIIIVGAGAAGLGAASELANSDLKVLLVDKKGEYHDLCVPHYFVKKMGLEAAIIKKFSFYSFYSEKYKLVRELGEKHIFAFINPQAAKRIILKRVKFDVLNDTEIIDAEYGHHSICLTDCRKRKYDGKIVIDCSGTSAVVATNLELNLQYSVCFFCYMAVLNSCDISRPQELSFNVDEKYSNGAAWVYPYDRKKAQVGVADILPYRISTKENLRTRLIRLIRKSTPYKEWFSNSRIDKGSIFVKIYPLSTVKSMVGDNLIIAGDSAGHTLPYIGEGFRPSMIMGIEAAKIAKKALEKGDLSKRGLIEFEKIWREHFGKYRFWAVLARYLGIHYNNRKREVSLRRMKNLTDDEFFNYVQSKYTLKLLCKIIGIDLLFKCVSRFELRFPFKNSK